ncbi:MAG: S-methyl-5-thioribose-1-phosphate isomerase [Planctomycetota bacterium]|nr:MAG: S-methyl-5-thioribose-1-phosphate isomerase [Planctomycetota bacterium]
MNAAFRFPRTVEWRGDRPGHVRLLDQTRLPLEETYLEIRELDALHDAILRLAVRGAPAIGIAAGYGVALGLQGGAALAPAAFCVRAREVAAHLESARPTAVNLAWAARRVVARIEREHARGAASAALLAAALDEAHAIAREDEAMCEQMGAHGLRLVPDSGRVLTHCNAGALATGGIGTALAPLYCAARAGRRVAVYADETRPLLQGARLTAWELMHAGIEVTLITDNMAARVMAERRVDAVFVGSDRIAANGDVCNKIGTYGVAVLARHHGIPFYAVAPSSTFDLSIAHGGLIPIEQRGSDEICEGFGRRTAPPRVAVYNPAFDVTPAALVSAIVTERGVIEPVDEKNVRAVLARPAR